MISVIIPTYNCAEFLPDCLESVLRQTRKDHEIIVVDDGSTDGTASAVAPWRTRIRYIVQENLGAAAARNTAIRAATGEYLALLDADDLWRADKLELQIDALERNPSAGLVCSDFSIVHKDASVLPSYFQSAGGFETGWVFARLVRSCFVFTSTVVMRRSALQQTGPFDPTLKYCEDYNMWLRMAHRCQIEVVPEVLAIKRERPGNARPGDVTTVNQIRALANLEHQLQRMSPAERRLVTNEAARLRCALGRCLLVQRRRDEARRELRGALDSDLRTEAAGLLALTHLPSSILLAGVELRRRWRGQLPVQPVVPPS